MAKGRVSAALCGIALSGAVAVSAADDSGAEEHESELGGPDMEFLEYLGMWEESDADWKLLDKNAVAENETRSDPVPEGEASAENEDES